MMLFVEMISNLFPLFCPQILYKDRFGSNLQPFTEMNPAIFFDTDAKEWTVLVRGVSYRKYHNNVFTCYVNPLHSVYWIGTGPSLDDLKWTELKYEYGGLRIFSSYWNGVEDIRFITKDKVICCVPQLNSSGRPAIFTAHIQRARSVLTTFAPCMPNQGTEKNWMPFGNKVVYSVSPFYVKDIVSNQRDEIPLTPDQKQVLEGYHGSTNGVQYKDGWLFLIHKNQTNKVVHRWLHLKDQTIQVSPPFSFFKDSYIEFPCGLVLKDGVLFVSLGVNDCQAFVVQLEGLPF